MSTSLRVILTLVVLLVLLGLGIYGSVFIGQHDTFDSEDAVYRLPVSPFDATYRIEGEEVTLAAGRAERVAAPGSAATIVTELQGEPVPLYRRDERYAEYAVLLRESTAGTGGFYYLALALEGSDGFLGSEATYLGDRIEDIKVQPWGELMQVSYQTRATNTSFASPPDLSVTRYFYVLGASLLEHGPFGIDVRAHAGHVQERAAGYTVSLCDGEQYVLASSSPAYAALHAVYAERAAGGISAFMQLALRGVAEAQDGDVVVLEAVLAAPEGLSCADVVPVSNADADLVADPATSTATTSPSL